MPKKNFYAVAVGRKTGIFPTWDLCWEQVNGYPGGKQKGFQYGQEKEAQEFLASNQALPSTSILPTKVCKTDNQSYLQKNQIEFVNSNNNISSAPKKIEHPTK